MGFLKIYLSLLKTHTLPTQMVTGGITSGIGDILYQQAFERRGLKGHESYRTRRLMTFGFLVFAPVANRWHFLLNKVSFDALWKTVAARVIIDQSIFAPLATTLFIASQGVMDGTPAAGIRRRLEERIIPTWQKQVMLFGPAQTINFAFVPLQLRPPYMNGISIFWSCFLASTHTPSVEVALHADKIGEEDLAVLAVEIL